MAEKKCEHGFYKIKDGQLVCDVCGEPSPKARLVDGVIVKIEKVIVCPHCGGRLNENGQSLDHKGLDIEDKMVKKTRR